MLDRCTEGESVGPRDAAGGDSGHKVCFCPWAGRQLSALDEAQGSGAGEKLDCLY